MIYASSTFSFRRTRDSGFTLVELMVTLAIAVVLASIAAPSFQSMLASQRVQAATSDLLAHLMLARSEAIKQNRSITLLSPGGEDAWHGGWQIFPANAAAALVKAQSAYANIAITAAVDNVTYNRDGRVAANQPVSFAVTDPSLANATQARCIRITVTGMPISEKGECDVSAE